MQINQIQKGNWQNTRNLAFVVKHRNKKFQAKGVQNCIVLFKYEENVVSIISREI